MCKVGISHFKLCRSTLTLGDLDLVDSSHAAAQLSLHITPSRVQVTSEDNFWATMLKVGPGEHPSADPRGHCHCSSRLCRNMATGNMTR